MALDLVYPRPSVEGDALPFFAEPVAAGFPSPAAGYEANELNLHDYCVRRPAATYFLRVSGILCVMPAFMMAMCWSSIGQKSPGTAAS